MPEAEEPRKQRPVPDQVVERADERRRRRRAVELHVRQDVERSPVVLHPDLAQTALPHECLEVLVQSRLAALQPPVLANRRLCERAAGGDREHRERPQRLLVARRRRFERLLRDHALCELVPALEAATFFAGGAGGQADVAITCCEDVNQVRAFELLDDPCLGRAQRRLC